MLLARARLPVVFVDSDPSLPSWEGLRLVFGGSGKMGRLRLQQNDRAVNIQTNEIRYGLLRRFSGMIPMKGLTILRRPAQPFRHRQVASLLGVTVQAPVPVIRDALRRRHAFVGVMA